MPRARRADVLLVAVGAFLWGTGGLTGAALARGGMGALTVASWRLGAGGVLLLVGLALVGRLHRVRLSRQLVVRVVVTGVLAAVYQGVYFAAVAVGSVSVATLVALGAAPVMVAVLTWFLTRTAPSGRTVAAMVLGMLGLVLVVGAPTGGSAPVLGAVLALVPAAAFATMTVVNRSPVPGLGPLELTGLSFTLGSLLLVPIAIALGGALRPSTSSLALLVLWLGLGPTALAYGAYFAGLRTVPGTTASVLALLEPLTASLGAALLFGERLGVTGLIGAGLLLLAVLTLRPVSPTMTAGSHLPA